MNQEHQFSYLIQKLAEAHFLLGRACSALIDTNGFMNEADPSARARYRKNEELIENLSRTALSPDVFYKRVKDDATTKG